MMFANKFVLAGAAVLAVPLLFLASERTIVAADHNDPPTRVDPNFAPAPDRTVDISDIYTFYTPDTVVVAMGFAGPIASNLSATYDRNILYKLNISNAGSRTDPEITISFRFGQDTTKPNAHGVRITGLPGVTGTLEGPVESTLTKDGVRVRAGLYDDPFFFDSAGFRETNATGELMIRTDRDFFRGKNGPSLVMEFPRNRIQNGSNLIDIWGTASRFGG